MRAHGSFDLWVDNQVLMARISGAWNEEGGWRYFKALKQISQPIIDKPWALLVSIDEWELGTPETDRAALAMLEWITQHGVARLAEIYSPNILLQLEVARMGKKIPFEIEQRHFSDEVTAFKWLASQGFPVQLAQLQNRQPQS